MKEYFFGHYFKCQSKDGTAAVIPAIHKRGGKTSASVQIITDGGAWNVPFSASDYRKLGDGFSVSVGKSGFRRDGITLSIKTDEVEACGDVGFGDFSPIHGDIMGPFRFVPFLECRHEVVSMGHTLSGSLTVNGKRFDFTDGKGYIEGDRGRSFPEVYLWTHTFFPGGSLMLSVAKIPFGFMDFTGIIGVIMKDGKEYRIATYRGAKVKKIGGGAALIRQGKYALTAKLTEKRSFPLCAPQNGEMTRTIREGASCRARYTFKRGDETILDTECDNASFEYEYPE